MLSSLFCLAYIRGNIFLIFWLRTVSGQLRIGAGLDSSKYGIPKILMHKWYFYGLKCALLYLVTLEIWPPFQRTQTFAGVHYNYSCKSKWLTREERHMEVHQISAEKLKRCFYGLIAMVIWCEEITYERFFSFSLALFCTHSSASNNEVLCFMEDPDPSTAGLSNHNFVRKVFVRYNTALLSSTHIDRVFNVAAGVFTKKWGKITEENFEKQLSVKIKNVWRAAEDALKEPGQLFLVTVFVQYREEC